MREVLLSPAARLDLREIWLSIAEDSITAADGLVDRITELLQTVGEFPLLGHLREDMVLPPLRILTEGSYQIIYNPERDPIWIVRILHASRDIQSLGLGE